MRNRLTLKDNATAETGSRFEIDLIGLFRLLLKRRRWIVGVTGLVAVAAVAIMLTTPNRYTSRATVLPTGKTGNLSTLKAMAGLAGGFGMSDENSSALYPVILSSPLISDALLSKTYKFRFQGEDIALTLPEYIGKEDPDRLRRSLAGMTTVSTSNRTGEITIAVETEYPELSRALVNEYVNQLESYNLHSRRSEARERVRYLTREVADRYQALEKAEDSLEAFQNRNRNWAQTSNPVLLRSLGRLKRDVEIRSKTYGYLLQEFEIAKLDAQKDVPIVRILGEATLPTQKSGPFRSITVITATFVAFSLMILTIFVIDLIQKTSTQVGTGSKDLLREDIESAFPRTARLVARHTAGQERTTISVDS